MENLTEITVILKDAERTYKKKILAYNQYVMSKDDAFLKVCIDETQEEAKFEPDEVSIKVSMVF